MALIIPKNKTELIFNIDSSTSGSEQKQVVIEDDAFSGILIVTEGSATLEVFEQIDGQPIGDPIATTGEVASTSVTNLYADSSNNIIVKITYSGPCRLQVKGKGVGKSSASLIRGIDKYLAVQVDGYTAIVDHQFGRFPLVDAIIGEVTENADAFTFDGFRLDAFGGGQTQHVRLQDNEYTIKYLGLNCIQFTQPTPRNVILLLRA